MYLLLGAVFLAGTAVAVPQRVVSTALLADEILHALIGDSQRLVALSALATNELHSNIYHLPHLPAVLKATSVEHVVSLRPDLIVYSMFNRPEFVNLARHLGIDTIVLQKTTRLEHILANIVHLGKRVGAALRAQALVEGLRQKLIHIAASRQGRARPRVLNFFADNTVMGLGTLFDVIVKHAGGINLAAQQKIHGFRIISREILATLQPDFIVIPTGIYQPQEVVARLSKASVWKHMRAVKQQKFIFIPSRELMATSHYAFAALEKMHAAFGIWATMTPTGRTAGKHREPRHLLPSSKRKRFLISPATCNRYGFRWPPPAAPSACPCVPSPHRCASDCPLPAPGYE